jgi:hypothetical protein
MVHLLQSWLLLLQQQTAVGENWATDLDHLLPSVLPRGCQPQLQRWSAHYQALLASKLAPIGALLDAEQAANL